MKTITAVVIGPESQDLVLQLNLEEILKNHDILSNVTLPNISLSQAKADPI
jgi:hypothetical protein